MSGLRALPVLIIPLLVLIASAGYQSDISQFSTDYSNMLALLPPFLLGLAALIGLSLKQSKIFFLSLILGLGYGFYALALPQLPVEHHAFYATLLTTLFIFNVASIVITQDRGILSLGGKTHLGIIAAQCLLFGLMPHDWLALGQALLNQTWPLNAYFSTSQQLVLTAALGVSIVLLSFELRRKEPIIGTAIGIILCLSIDAMQLIAPPNTWLIYCATASLLLFAAIQNGYRMAFIDTLTELPNRRALEYRLSRLPRRYTIAMLDVDHFKKFNDTYGHDVGDQVLKLVASKVKQVNGGGKPARYGGEEFTVVFSGQSKAECKSHLESLRQEIENTRFTVRKNGPGKRKKTKHAAKGKNVSVTISIGSCERGPKHRIAHTVIKGADQALYRAKKAGRNCVK